MLGQAEDAIIACSDEAGIAVNWKQRAEADLPEEAQAEGFAGDLVWVVLEQAGSHEPDGV